MIAGVIGMFYVSTVLTNVPDVTEEALQSDPSSNMYAANGDLIWSSAKNRRIYVEREDMPDRYVDMLLATEQKTFYDDKGFSPTGLANAFLSVIKSAMGEGEIRGGSSIEQQLIKLTVFSTGEEHRTIDRKIQEFYLANQLYENYTKDDILEFYVNKLPLSENSFGAQTLAKTYYNQPLSELTDGQLALIVGSGQAPSAYNVYDNPKDAETRRNDVLYISHNDGILTDEAYEAALNEPIDHELMPRHWQNAETEATMVAHDAYVQEALKQIESLGYNINETPIQIHTALDTDLNNAIKEMYDNEDKYFQDDTQQSAATVIENDTGKVLAQIGGRHITEVNSYNRATQTVRSTGSSTKPFIYAAGMEHLGWGTNQIFNGAPYNYAGTNAWANNYGMQTVGDVTMQNALRYSYNTPILRAYDQVGADAVAQTLSNFGYVVPEDLAVGKALGFEASTADVANAFAIMSNGGVKRTPQYVTKLVFSDNSEKVIEQEGEQTISEGTAWILLHMLQGTPYLNPDETYNAHVEGLPQALKTGTVGYADTVDHPYSAVMDLWTAGTTPSVSLAIWHGYDKPLEDGWLSEDTMRQKKFDLYRDIIKKATRNYENEPWTKPDTAVNISGSGLNAHYRPEHKPRTYFNTTVPELHDDTEQYYGDAKANDIERDDASYESIDEDYDIEGWTEDLEKHQEATDKDINALEEEQSQAESEWEEERQPHDESLQEETEKTRDIEAQHGEKVRELEREMDALAEEASR